MKDAYILITGGAGYIGSHVNKLLNKKGYKTVILDNLSTGHKEFIKWGEFILGDIVDTGLLELIFTNYNITAVMHFASFIAVGESTRDPVKYYKNNLLKTLLLLEYMIKHSVKYFIFSSTAAVYGEPTKIPIDEEDSILPINPYGHTKSTIEEILRYYNNTLNLKYVSLRYFNAAGADPDREIGEWHNPETHLIPLVLDVAIGKSEAIKVFGTDYPTPDGTCIRDFIHVMDLAQAHVLALEYLLDNGNSNVFNLGNGNGFSVKEVICAVEEITKKKIKIIETTRRTGDVPILVASAKKARKILKWEPKYNKLQTIIKTAWEWHKKFYKEYRNDR